MPIAHVASLDQEGRGIARVGGKVVFIQGALPGETVQYKLGRRNPRFDLANVERVLHASSLREPPRCPHYARCGGCSLQHLDPRAQVATKQRVLEEALARIGKVQPESLLAPIHGSYWGYRHRARLSAKHVPEKGGVLVGFHERRVHRVVDMNSCAVLPPHISALIRPLRELLTALTTAHRIPQVEVAVGAFGDALTFRVLDPLAPTDLAALRAFESRHAIDIYLQPAGVDSVHPLNGKAQRQLAYRLPEFDITIKFEPADFTQVNEGTNQMLVRRAMAMLEPQAGERIVDMFCGVGNFTLPIARSGAHVVGLEGSVALVKRAAQNARDNGLAENAKFAVANLFTDAVSAMARFGRIDRMLIDPPRSGADAVIRAFPSDGLSRIVYVSCNPATLARDAGVLVHEKGYRLLTAGVVNMFPHTSHVESVASFMRR
ncbi:MAG: 23S rRNA (uracil(1939)-C(5))-methyltransferase RlmD [Betaproteobacteria bacterium]